MSMLRLDALFARGVAPSGTKWFRPAVFGIEFLSNNAADVIGQEMQADRWFRRNRPNSMDIVPRWNEFIEVAFLKQAAPPWCQQRFRLARLMFMHFVLLLLLVALVEPDQ